ncbi:MAG: hypothetical protein JO331_15915, partial [Verrucomicrobia bacterium]|nr:hypothetical protein [Verrucomicrobiota bacterium]
LSTKASIKDDPATSDQEVATMLDKLKTSKIALEENLATARQSGLFEDGPETLTAAYQNVSGGYQSRLNQIAAILSEIERVLPTPDPNKKEISKVLESKVESRVESRVPESKVLESTPQDRPEYALLRDLKAKLLEISEQLKTQVASTISQPQVDEFKTLDEAVLTPGADKQPIYLWRWDLYGQCQAGAPEFHYSDKMTLIGDNWRPLQQLSAALTVLRGKVADYQGKLKEQFTTTCTYLLRRTEDTQRETYASKYLLKAKAVLRDQVRFPLLWPPSADSQALKSDQVRQVKTVLGQIRQDLQSDTLTKMGPASRQPLTDFSKGLSSLYVILDALLKTDGSPSVVTVTLLNGQAQRQLSGPNYGATPTPVPTATPTSSGTVSTAATPVPTLSFNPRNWNAIQLISGGKSRDSSGNSRLAGLDGQSDVLLGKFRVNESFHFRVFHTPTGGGAETVNCGDNWSALRVLARFAGKPVDVGQTWRVSLKPGEPTAVWIQLAFESPIPGLDAWPTIDSLGLREIAGQ